jgi:hypothetical protein
MSLRQDPLLELHEEIRWFGQKILTAETLNLGNMSRVLPKFRREGFGANEYLDMIVRQPDRNEPRSIPVAAVSKRYALIQHAELVQWVSEGLKDVVSEPSTIPVQLWMTEYGERLRVRFSIPEQSFDPGDGYNVVLAAECFNSVDKSCALEMRMLWLRLVCTNGLVSEQKSKLRKVHDLVWMSRKNPAEFLREKLAAAGDFRLLRMWIGQRVSADAIEQWANNVIAKEWNNAAAARVCHIARSGWDGIVAPGSERKPAHLRQVSSDVEVPGACAPAENLYHVSQVLSWIASKRPTIEEQGEWMRNIPKLLKQLLPSQLM